MISRTLLLCASVFSLSFADVSFTSPSAGASVTGTTIDVEWEDGGGSPALSALTSYDLFLCAGGNTADSYIQLAPLKNAGKFADGSSASGTFQVGLGADVKNAYFLKMISNGATGSVINYSKRFSIPSMTGTFPSNVQTGVKAIKGTDGPPTEQKSSGNGAAAGAAGDFGVPYLQQSGPTRYAPMPKVPSSKITVKAASMQYPTFPFSIFMSNMGTPDASITVTQPQTFSASSREAPMTPAPMPFDSDMAKFLRRWAD